MMKGYFKLTVDVKNPRPDRRSKRRIECADIWPAGTVVWIVDTRVTDFKKAEEIAGERLPGSAADMQPRGYIRFPNHSQIMFDLGGNDRFPEAVQGNGIIAACEPAQKTLGQILKQADWQADDLLGLLIDMGKITLQDVDAIKNHDLAPEHTVDTNAWDAANEAFRKRHEI